MLSLPIGISDFKAIIEKPCDYVDKTLFIRDILHDNAGVILLTRPRRFGKTLNMMMLKYFLDLREDNQHLFQHLNIAKEKTLCQQYQNQYPVIYLTLKDIKELSYERMYGMFQNLIAELYEEYDYLLETLKPKEQAQFNRYLAKQASSDENKKSLKFLSHVLSRHYNQKVFILIDEYDTPIHASYMENYYKDCMDFMRGFFGAALKDNVALEKCVMTGILRIAQESIFSDLNNVSCYTVLSKFYADYFGFTQAEVNALAQKANMENHLPEIKKWYNGYLIGGIELYNPWSIINYFKNDGELRPYWINTSGNRLIEEALLKGGDEVSVLLEQLIRGESIEQSIAENMVFKDLDLSINQEALFSLLLFSGYLKLIGSQPDAFGLCRLAIPNFEVKKTYEQWARFWLTGQNGLANYYTFLKALTTGDIETFSYMLQQYLTHSVSFFELNKNAEEVRYHIFILGLVAGLQDRYDIKSNCPVGRGRCDILLLPKDKNAIGIVMELKRTSDENLLEKTAQEALTQIESNQYIAELIQRGIKTILKLGFAFAGREVKILWK